jgi:hypothetical protein
MSLIVACPFFVFGQMTEINIPFYHGRKTARGHFFRRPSTIAAIAGVEVTTTLCY